MSGIADTENFLVVDDDAPFRQRLSKALRTRGYRVYEASTHTEAMCCIKDYHPSRVILDLKMPEASGIETLRKIKAIAPDTSVLILTGYGSIATALEAVREGAVHYVTKPADVETILGGFAKSLSQEVSAPITAPSLPEVEWNHIQRVMSDCEGNISQAAKVLGLHRRSLQRKLKNPPAKTA